MPKRKKLHDHDREIATKVVAILTAMQNDETETARQIYIDMSEDDREDAFVVSISWFNASLRVLEEVSGVKMDDLFQAVGLSLARHGYGS